jgi:hypothetical protein|tara:strand:+ start:10712 stop:11119 length:408 start_codon:yes stop_codon:yes gene_type:complete
MDKDAVGLGIALTEVRFSSWFEDRGDSTSSVRLQKRIRWRSLFTRGTDEQRECVQSFLGNYGLKLQKSYHRVDDVEQFLILFEKIESVYGYTPSDIKGLRVIRWLYDNPPPANWEKFVDWAPTYDRMYENLEKSL